MSGPLSPRALTKEARLLVRDGPVKYVRLRRKLRRFHRAVQRMERSRGV